MRALVLAVITLYLPILPCVGAESGGPGERPVPVEFFFEAGCDSCAEIRRDVLPELDRRYSGLYTFYDRDIGVQSNYLRLVAIQTLLGTHENEPVSMVVEGRTLLAGVVRIKQELFAVMDAALAGRLSVREPERVMLPDAAPLLRQRVDTFTLTGIIGAAVVDSINPCAISSLVFFMSLLSVARIGRKGMWLAGGSFLAACFVTYLAIGFGLFKVLEFLTAFHGVKRLVEFVLMGMMVIFAVLSFRDAFRYHRTGRAQDVSLKLPASLQARIHQVMKTGLRKHNLIAGGLGIGVAVTLLESVCTGQVYVPALVMIIKSGQSMLRSALYLVLYNAIFVLPLGVVLVLTCGGMNAPTLVEWSRRNVTFSKVLLGVFFLAMTALMLVME